LHIYFLAQEMIKLGYKCIVLCISESDKVGIRYLSNGLKVHFLPLGAFGAGNDFNLYGITAGINFDLLLLRQILIREQVDLIHT